MSKQKFKITNWSAYNNAQPEGRGRPLHYTDMAITTVLMMKSVFNLPRQALQGFVYLIFKLVELPLCCLDYSLVSKRAKSVNISIKTPTRGEISHLLIDSTGQKVFGEGEWKVRQHGAVWRKLHLAADSVTHEIICADLSLCGTTDAQALPALINKTHRKIKQASADGAYDVSYCHDALMKKIIRPLIPPRNGAQYWPDKYHERNYAVANQHLSGCNDIWKKKTGYYWRSVAETAMYRIKTLLSGHLSLQDYDAQRQGGITNATEGAILSADSELFNKDLARL